ncbi:MAG: hypothetical protein OFPI_23410 [Osedax symbiont Rs2]|nr:MAG: hypothetical protein OFPI_23410 [Osedax symbiont Rs2]
MNSIGEWPALSSVFWLGFNGANSLILTINDPVTSIGEHLIKRTEKVVD